MLGREETAMAYDVYKTITVSPLSPHLGAEISGVDLSKPLSFVFREMELPSPELRQQELVQETVR